MAFPADHTHRVPVGTMVESRLSSPTTPTQITQVCYGIFFPQFIKLVKSLNGTKVQTHFGNILHHCVRALSLLTFNLLWLGIRVHECCFKSWVKKKRKAWLCRLCSLARPKHRVTCHNKTKQASRVTMKDALPSINTQQRKPQNKSLG